jgi:uncharacterized protein (TIGR02099 family)
MIRHIKKPIKPLWYLLAFVIIAFAVLIQTARLTTPYIDRFHESLETFASEQIGAQVSFGQLNASWYGLRPKVNITDLRVQSLEQEAIVDIAFASMELDILSSLVYWIPVWKKVSLEGLELLVTQDEQGGWSVGGVSADANSGRGWRYRSPSALFLMANEVDIDRSEIKFLFHNQQQFTTEVPSIVIENNGHFHRLNAQALIEKGQLGEEGTLFNFVLEGVGDPSDPEHFFAKAYLDLNYFPLERLAFLFSQVTDAEYDIEGSASSVDMDLWFDFTSPSHFLLNGNVSLLSNQPTDFAKSKFLDIPFTADLSGDYSIKSGLTLGMRNARIDNNIDLGESSVNLHDGLLTAAFKYIDLQKWSEWSQERVFHSSDVAEVIQSLSLSGVLENTHVTLDFKNIGDSQIIADVKNVKLNSWDKVPAFKNISGYVESSFKGGFIAVDARDFDLHAEKIYQNPLRFNQARGLVGWRFVADKREFDIYGQSLSVESDFGSANGNFLLTVPHPDRNDYSDLTLQIGLRNSSAEFHEQLTPSVLSEDLTDWMKEAIVAGSVGEAGFFYRGGFSEGTERTIQLYVDVDGGELKFSPDWPAIKDIDAFLSIDNKKVYALVDQSRFYKGDSFSGLIEWNRDDQERLSVKAGGETKSVSGLKFIRESWLQGKTAGVFDGWSADGLLDVSVDLSLALLNDSVDNFQKINIGFKNNNLLLEQQELVLENVTGSVIYQTGEGFSSDGLEVNVFDNVLPLKITGQSALSDSLIIQGEGFASVNALSEWLKQPFYNIVQGRLGYQLELKIPVGDNRKTSESASLNLFSNLKGTSVNLPQPFGKKKTGLLPLNVKVEFLDDAHHYEIDYSDVLYGKFLHKELGAVKGVVSLSDAKLGPSKRKMPLEGISIYGDFNHADIKAYIDILNRFSNDEGKSAFSSKVDYQFTFKKASYDDRIFSNVNLSGQREDSGWLSVIDSDFLQGAIYIDDDREQPLVVNIDYLRWPPEEVESEEEEESDIDPWSDFDTSGLRSANIKIKQLYYKDKLLGTWSLEMRPEKAGLDLRNIYANTAGISLTGSQADRGAYLRWQYASDSNPMSTRFIGRLSGGDLNNLFNQLQLPPLLESKKTDVYAELSWLGSPAFFSGERLDGLVDITLEDGVFVQEENSGATDALKLLGLMNFDTWGRRIRLDFSDLYKKGFVFDSFAGKLSFDKGVINTLNPVTVDGPSSKLVLTGQANYSKKTIDAELKATLPIAGNLTVATALAGGLPAAAGVFVVSKIFGKQIDKASTIGYTIDGSWDKPVIKVDNPKQKEDFFEDNEEVESS